MLLLNIVDWIFSGGNNTLLGEFSFEIITTLKKAQWLFLHQEESLNIFYCIVII